MQERLKFFFGALVFGAIVVVVALFSNGHTDTTNQTKVYFLNVGQGDAEYIKLKNGQDILIDGGPDNSVLNELGKVMSFNDHKIDLVVLTHPHADHITGLVQVINRYQIGEIWESGADYPSSIYDQWKTDVKSKNITDIDVTAGKSENFGNDIFKVLYPLLSEKNKTMDDLNNSSVITELDDNKISFLFLGDAQKQAQQEILPELHLITAMKVGHHGSSNGTLEAMLQVTRPAVGVIEVGKKNTYGHPHAVTLNLLKKYAVQIFRTDQNGTVEVSADGLNYTVNTNQ